MTLFGPSSAVAVFAARAVVTLANQSHSRLPKAFAPSLRCRVLHAPRVFLWAERFAQGGFRSGLALIPSVGAVSAGFCACPGFFFPNHGRSSL